MRPDPALLAWLDLVRALADDASARILEVYHRAFDVTFKADHSPLTAADLAAHEVIVAGLSALTPALPVLSEESAEVPFEVRSRWLRYWLVDPLDGTKEFIQRNGEFTVNIALIVDQAPVLGVIQVPVTGVSYFALKGYGAFRVEPGASPTPIHASAFRRPLRVVGSRSHGGQALQDFVAQLGDCECLTVGSSLKGCLVAEGRADLYPRFGPTCEWDTAAAQAILEAAGGAFLSAEDGQPLRYNTRSSLRNPDFLACGGDMTAP